MSGDYYILEDGEQTGPFSFDELTDMGLEIHTRVLSPLAEGWLDACDLPEFYPYFEANGIYFPTGDNLASFWWRMLAFLIDYVIVSILLTILFVLAVQFGLTIKVPTIDDLLKESFVERLRLMLVIYLALIIYNSAGEASAWEGSIGKKICGLVVVDVDGQGLSYPRALLRSFGKAISLFINGLGFLSVFWSEHRQALHDYIAKTYVVKLD
jgi:uncharacterized RDD family membrane protein YckC